MHAARGGRRGGRALAETAEVIAVKCEREWEWLSWRVVWIFAGKACFLYALAIYVGYLDRHIGK